MAHSAFDNDYKIAINNILRDLYGNTDYWGVGKAGNQGIIKPITSEDDPNWSNYNFLNTHYIVKDKIVIPYILNISDVELERNKKYTQSTNNTYFFKLLWRERENLFGLNSPLKDKIVRTVNSTRRSGDKRENFVKLVLESLPNTTVEMISLPGGSSDFAGVDLIIKTTNSIFPSNELSAQVKPFNNISKGENNWYVNTDALRRDYNTDLMIFGKQNGQEYHIAVFLNKPEEFQHEPNRVIIPINLCKVLINYNAITGKSNVKSF